MSEPALIIFDVDGTLFQSRLVTVPAIRETLSAFGVPPPDEDAIQKTFGIPVHEYEAWLAGLCRPGQAAEIVAATNRRELELIGETGALFPGIYETLRTLHASGHILATCTNASVPYLTRFLKAFKLRPIFARNVCIGEGFPNKTMMIRHIMDELTPRPAIVVGDRLGDIEAAKANEAYAIAADYGYGDAEELEDADAHARSAEDIALLVEHLTAMHRK